MRTTFNMHFKIFLIYGYLIVFVDCITDTKTKIACEGQILSLECAIGQSINILHVNYGRITGSICPHSMTANKNCKSAGSFAVVSQACNKKKRCEVGASNAVFGDPCVGTYKYLHVQYQCVDALPCKEEQFQCNDGSCISADLIWDGIRNCPSGDDEVGSDYESAYACESQTLNINCRRGEIIIVINANYGRLTKNICAHPALRTTNCKSTNTLNLIKNSCTQKPSCSIPSTNNFFGDPCVGTYKYTEVHYQCSKLPNCTTNEFQCYNGHCIHNSKKCDGIWHCPDGEDEHGCDYFTDFACEHSVLDIQCKANEVIEILNANYGRHLKYLCTYQNNVNCSAKSSKKKVEERCRGKQTCKIGANNAEFGDPCRGTIKYLLVNYKCIGK